MPYIPPEVVSKAKQMDLYTYLKTYEPQELVHFGGSTYCTREHDSLKISNGKWYWFSRGIGGRSALDYLIKVKGIPFMEAVEAIPPPAAPCTPKENKVKSLCLPEASRCATHATNYLAGRGIDYDLLDFCSATGRLYESQKYHNVVFVGQDKYGKPRYANLRGIGSDRTSTASPAMPTCAASVQTSRARPAAATSVFPSASPQRWTAILCTCLKAPSTCYPMPRSASRRAWTGRPITWYRWPGSIVHGQSCGKAPCRWR